MLSDLLDTIETLKLRIKEHGKSLRENETRTRMALIDPLLRTLGWDVSDPGIVIPEYKVEQGRGDYALLGPNGKPVAIVEAKKLGENLGSYRKQMLDYSNYAAVPYAGITDGDRWEMYEVFKQSLIDERRILELSIKHGTSHELALKLLLLWNRNLASGRPIPAQNPIGESETNPHPESPNPREPPSGDERDERNEEWTVISELDISGPKPTMIQFPDGIERRVKYWNVLLRVSVAWLWSSKHLSEDKLPIKKADRWIVDTNERNLRMARRVEQFPLFIEVDATVATLVSWTKIVFEECGVNLTDVRVQVR